MPNVYLVNAGRVVGQVETDTEQPAPYMRRPLVNAFFYASYDEAAMAAFAPSLSETDNTIWELRQGVYYPAYRGIPGLNGVPPLTAQERAGLWNGPPSPRFGASRQVDFTNVVGDVATPPGYTRVEHRYRTEFVPIGMEPVAMTPMPPRIDENGNEIPYYQK